jgi:hypothetical protein
MFFPESYTAIAWFLPKILGLIYFFAFWPFLFQIKGLIGTNGILPADKFLKNIKKHYPIKCYLYVPTLLWINSSNRALLGIVWLGLVCSITLLIGFFESWMLVFLYLIYLSIVTAGQDFLSFGWEGFLLEATVYTFLVSLTATPTLLSWICINFLLFRFYFMAGGVKLLSRDANWRNLTALAYHYQSQPLPNTIAWYVHKFPLWFHKTSTWLMFVIELIIPFGIFGSDAMRLGVFCAFFMLQWTIWITGNFSYLNHLSVALSIILLSNSYLSPFLTASNLGPSNIIVSGLVSFIAGIFIILQIMRFWQQLYPNKFIGKLLANLSFFHLVNPYGIFAVMTTERIEIIIEGSVDGWEWKEYCFKYKPSEVNRRPRRISPYQPRLDWQAWFLPFRYYTSEAWFQSFLYHLLKGTPDVLNLLRKNPFPDMPPKFIRSVMYEYRFSTWAEKKESGNWWIRRGGELFSPPMKLKD